MGATRRPGGATIAGALALVSAAAAALVLAERPAGSPGPSEAAATLVRERARPGSVEVLQTRRWGDGSLVLTRHDSRDGARRLAMSFVLDRGRGWRVVTATERAVTTTDVRVGSLLVTTSAGGHGQPAWSAVYGELSEARIRAVAVAWSDGGTTRGERVRDSYLVLRQGSRTANTAIFLGAEGAEIARVPIV